MEIIKYEKKGNNNYKVYLSNGKTYLINEDVILKYKLLYKKEIDESLLSEIIKDNNNYDIYNKCVNYIGIRIRSISEIREFMQRKGVEADIIEKTIARLLNQKLLNDDAFAKAYINDKIKFSSLGPYRIAADLKKQHIDDITINKYLDEITDKFLYDKITKQINKLIKSNHQKPNLKAKIYNNLINAGYDASMVIDIINEYDIK